VLAPDHPRRCVLVPGDERVTINTQIMGCFQERQLLAIDGGGGRDQVFSRETYLEWPYMSIVTSMTTALVLGHIEVAIDEGIAISESK